MTALPIQSIDAELQAAHEEQLGLQLPEAASSLRITYIRPIKIHPDPEQPRKEADDELRASIRESGILEPISVRHADPREGACADCGRSWHEIAGAGEYILVTGERRWRGAREVMEMVPAIIRDDLSTRSGERRITQLTENTAKKPLTAVEEALALEKIRAEEPSLSIARLALRTGMARQVVSDRLAALRHPRFRSLFERGEISSSQAVEAARFAEYSEADHDVAWAKLVAMLPRELGVAEALGQMDVREFRAALDIAYQVSTRAEGQLVVETPLACGRCGCTQERACEGGCGWASEDPPICTRCVKPGETFGADDEDEADEPAGVGAGAPWEDDARKDSVTAPDPAGAIEGAIVPCGQPGARAATHSLIAHDGTKARCNTCGEIVETAGQGQEQGEAVERESAPGATWGTSSSAPTPGTAAPGPSTGVEEHATAASERHGTATAATPDQARPASPLPPSLLAAIAPLLPARQVTLSVWLLPDGRASVLVMPHGLESLTVRGTLEEMESELPSAIARWIAAGPAELPPVPTPTTTAAGGTQSGAARGEGGRRGAKKASPPKKSAAKKSTTKQATARKAAPAKKPASSTATRRGKAVPEAAPPDATTQEARAVEPVEREGQARVEAASAVSGEAVTGANETLGDVGGEQSGSSTGPADTASSTTITED